MHARELVELAALAATQSRALVVGGAPLPRTSLEDYWANSKCLLGSLLDIHDVTPFAIDADRVRDFADQLHGREAHPGGQQAWTLALSSLRSAFKKGLSRYSPNGDVNARIANSILTCFSCEHFE